MGSAGGGRQEANSVGLPLAPRAHAASQYELSTVELALPICQARLVAFLLVMVFSLSTNG